MSIITNWELLLDEVKSLRVKGLIVDHNEAEDGSEIKHTSPIQFTDGKSITTSGGTVYFLGKPSSLKEEEKLQVAMAYMPEKHIKVVQPYIGVIENWQAINLQGNIRIAGNAYQSDRQENGSDILTSSIKHRNGNLVVTASGSVYALGTPKEGFGSSAKADLLNTLPELAISQQSLPTGTVFGAKTLS